MAKTKKYYVVWKGVNPGIYDEWLTCKAQVEGFDDAKYKSFETRQEAAEAFEKGHEAYVRPRRTNANPAERFKAVEPMPEKPLVPALCVDAACSGNPGDMEYRGVYYPTGQQIFRMGPMPKGTNNIGEFLALVHGLALLKQYGSNLPIYTDSRNAMSWVTKKKCRTLLERMPENEQIFDLIERAEKWLAENTFTTHIYKWDTERWGEIPADFGRK
jgi:ribonuclease HI